MKLRSFGLCTWQIVSLAAVWQVPDGQPRARPGAAITKPQNGELGTWALRQVLFLRVVFGRHLCRLPRDYLPFAIALNERAGVQIMSDLGFALFGGGADQPEGNDGGGSVLLDSDIFSAVIR